MDLEKFERDIKNQCNATLKGNLSEKFTALFVHIEKEWQIPSDELTLQELKVISEVVINTKTTALHNEVESLLVQQEKIERELERKRHELQDGKYEIFAALEESLGDSDITLAKLHQVKLQSVDIFDLVEEIVESAIITTLEKNQDIEETIEEIIKDITYETLNEGPLSSIRIRKVISIILEVTVSLSEATPNLAEEMIRGALRGIRSGLVKAIDRFKQNLLYMPEEAKILLVEDYASFHEELSFTDEIFDKVVITVANKSDANSKVIIERVNTEIRYDMEELVHISKETADVMKSNFSKLSKEAFKRGSAVLTSDKAQEAKRMGNHAWRVAKAAMNGAVKSAKDAMEKEK
jgi:hypothetical protein